MKKHLLYFLVCLLISTGARAQNFGDPAHWKIEAVPGNDLYYNFVFSVDLDSGWHIWSLKPGGDGTLIAPVFSFDIGNYTLNGDMYEQGKLKEEFMEGIDGKVRYFFKKAEFIQSIKARQGELITGAYTYQLCSDMVCLPPKTIKFKYTIP